MNTFPTRQYPYRRVALTGAMTPLPALDAGAVYRFVLGLDQAPTKLSAAELASLSDPFAALLARGKFPLTLSALLDSLDEIPESQGGLPSQKVYLVGDGGKIPQSVSTSLARQLRFAISRSRLPGGDVDLLVSTSTLVDSEATFLQLIAWDDSSGVFRYYERRMGAWVLAGDSWDAINEPSRGKGPFDSHVNGSLVMKELKLPWSHWHSMASSIDADVLPIDDPILNSPLWKNRVGGEVFETEVARPGVRRWTRARLRRLTSPDGVVRDMPKLLRQLVMSTTVNLVSSETESGRASKVSELRLPTEFFLDFEGLVGLVGLDLGDDPRVFVNGGDYAAARSTLKLRLDDGAGFRRDGETFFAFLVPERAFEDNVVAEALLSAEVVSPRLLACLLMVDFANPVYSDRRAALLKYSPSAARGGDQGADLDQQFAARVEASPGAEGSAEREFLELWAHTDEPGWIGVFAKRLVAYLELVRKRLGSQDGVTDVLRLAQGRRQRFRKSSLAEFSLTVPRTDDDEQFLKLRMHPDGLVGDN